MLSRPKQSISEIASLILCKYQLLMIQQKQSQFESRFNKLNDNKQGVIPRVKKQPLPILKQEKKQLNAKFNKFNNGTYNNPQNLIKNRMQMPDLYVLSHEKYSQSADKYKLQSRVPSQLQQNKQKSIPNGIPRQQISKKNSQVYKLAPRYLQKQAFSVHNQSSFQKQQAHNRQSKLMKRRCCNDYQNQQNNQQEREFMKRHKSCSEQQILNKLKMRKLQPLKFSIKSKMDFNNAISASPQHMMNMRTKKDKVLSKNQQKQLAQKLSRPKQFFHKCDKKFCECFKMQIAMEDDSYGKGTNNRGKVQNQDNENFNIKMKKTRRMIKLKPLRTQPTTIQVEQPSPIVHYQNLYEKNSQTDFLADSRAKNIRKTRRTLQEIAKQQQSLKGQNKTNQNQNNKNLQPSHYMINKEYYAKQIQVQTDQYQLLQRQLVSMPQKRQPLDRKLSSQIQAISVNTSMVNSQISANKGYSVNQATDNKKLSKQKLKDAVQVQAENSLKSDSKNRSNKSRKLSLMKVPIHHQLKSGKLKNQQKRQKQHSAQQSSVQQSQQQESSSTVGLKKSKIRKNLQNSHQYDFVIQLKTSKQEKFKKQILNHLDRQKTIVSQSNRQEMKLEKTAHFKQILKSDEQYRIQDKQLQQTSMNQPQNFKQMPFSLGLLTATKNNRQQSAESKLQDSILRLSVTKSNHSNSKKKYPNQFNKSSSLSKSSKNNIIFRVPKEQQLLEFIKKYKCLNSEFDMKNLIIHDNFKALSYKDGIYFGLMQNQKPNGRGIFLNQRQLYQGEFQNDAKIKGCLKTSDGIYQGQFFNNLRHGQGKFIWNNGQMFEGQWRLGTKNGYGKWESPDGSTYLGEWSLNMQHGKGKFVHPTSSYQGHFQKFLKHGNGIQIFPNGDRYQGQYKEGKPNGFGKYCWGDGAYYQGTFCNGLRQGTGKWHQNSDTLYQGQFFQDQKHGHGVQFYKNGNYFQGEFHNGIIKEGTMYDPFKKQIKRASKEDNI